MTQTKIGWDRDKKTNILDIKPIKVYGECEWCENEKEGTLYIPFTIWTEWLYIMRRLDKKEWGAVMWVEEDVVVRYFIPEQEVSAASCEWETDQGSNGVMHSHHGMGAFHSGQDDRAVRNLYEYSLVLASNGVTVSKKITLPCGGVGYKKMDVMISEVPELHTDNIKEKTCTYKNKNEIKDWRRWNDQEDKKDSKKDELKNQRKRKREELEKENEELKAEIEDLQGDLSFYFSEKDVEENGTASPCYSCKEDKACATCEHYQSYINEYDGFNKDNNVLHDFNLY